MKKIKFRGLELAIACLIFLLALCVWLALSVQTSLAGAALFFFTIVALACLFFINLKQLVVSRNQRITRAIICILILAEVFCFVPMSMTLHLATQRKWFLKAGMQEYNLMVDKIVQNRAILSEKGTRLEGIAGHDYVFGRTNSDGSIIIEFHGRGGNLRAGYLYYSGDLLRAFPGDTNLYLYHLTNGWYVMCLAQAGLMFNKCAQ